MRKQDEKTRKQTIRDLAKDVAFLIVICGTKRRLALKKVGCTDENINEVNDLVDFEIEFLRQEISTNEI